MTKRVLALDVGDRTIGVAVSDALGITAQGVETIRRKSWDKDFARLAELMRLYETDAFVIGFPKNMNGILLVFQTAVGYVFQKTFLFLQ